MAAESIWSAGQFTEPYNMKKGEISDVSLSEPNKLRLIRELEMHRMELELQNEELQRAKKTTELAEKKYKELYDFSPSGYLTLSKIGEIISLNISAEGMLVVNVAQISRVELNKMTNSYFPN